MGEALTSYRVIGCDPALTNTGLVVLESAAPSDYRVIDANTITTSDKKPMIERLNLIHYGVMSFLFARAGGSQIVIEDPTCQKAIKRQIPRNIAVMSMAVGVVVGAVLHADTLTPVLMDPDEWMPKKLTGNLKHIMPHAEIIRYLHGVIRLPPKCSEHVIMAAGVARFWIEQQRMKARLSA